MTQPGTPLQQEKIEGLSDHSETAILGDLTSPQEVSFFEDRTSQQPQTIEEIEEELEREKWITPEARVAVTSADVTHALLELKKSQILQTEKAKTVYMPTPYIVSLLISTAVSAICGASIYLGVVTGKTLFDPYASLFWFVGGIGIVLMSLKGISTWRSK